MTPNDPNLEMDFTLESDKSGVIVEPAFQIIVLGDWAASGRKSDVGQRRPIEIDRDNFDSVMRGLAITLDLDIEGERISLEFNSLDDFHPDALFKSVPRFSDLRDLRKRLINPDTFNSAASALRGPETMSRSEEPNVFPVVQPESPVGDSLLDAILAKPEGGGVAPKTSAEIDSLVRDLVRPHLVSIDEEEQSGLVSAVDEAASLLMRSILHNPDFQELEAAWRGLFFLVRRTETSSDLRIFILDASLTELVEDVKGEAFLFKVVSEGWNGDPYAAIFGNYSFSPEAEGVAALIGITRICSVAGTPFVSHILPDLLGIESIADHPDPADWDLSYSSIPGKLWGLLRGIPESRYLGLTLSRFLARLPYGRDTEPTESIAFEEFTATISQDDYLWSNGCFGVAQLLGQTYREFGWAFGDRFIQDIEGLPFHVFKREGETVFQSCAEAQLSQNAAEKLADHGLMPIVSFKNTDRIRLVRFQSVADGVRGLEGRWS